MTVLLGTSRLFQGNARTTTAEGNDMTTATAPPAEMTADEFQRWVEFPVNQGRWWELDQGRVIERPPPKPPHGTLCAWIAHLLWSFAIARGRGRVTTNDTA
jgi:Uma2 family endonuclease